MRGFTHEISISVGMEISLLQTIIIDESQPKTLAACCAFEKGNNVIGIDYCYRRFKQPQI